MHVTFVFTRSTLTFYDSFTLRPPPAHTHTHTGVYFVVFVFVVVFNGTETEKWEERSIDRQKTAVSRSTHNFLVIVNDNNDDDGDEYATCLLSISSCLVCLFFRFAREAVTRRVDSIFRNTV